MTSHPKVASRVSQVRDRPSAPVHQKTHLARPINQSVNLVGNRRGCQILSGTEGGVKFYGSQVSYDLATAPYRILFFAREGNENTEKKACETLYVFEQFLIE